MDHLTRDIDLLAAQLARARGVSPEEALTMALKESLARTKTNDAREAKLVGDALSRQIREISASYRALPVLDTRSPDEILGYGDVGVPT